MQTSPRFPVPRSRTPRPARSPRTAAVSVALTTLLATAGCGALFPDDGREAAEQVAEALSTSTVAEIDFAGDPAAQEEFQEVTEQLGEAVPTVAVDSVAEPAEDRHEAVLEWTWDLPGTEEEWAYESTLELVREDGRWAPVWARSVVAPSLEPGEALRTRAVAADRGDVLGADGEPLVTERPIRRVGIDRSLLDDADPGAAARELAAVLGIDPQAYAAAVAQAGPEAFVEAVPLRLDDYRELDAARLEAVPGLRVVEDELALAPSRGFATGVLGDVAEATAEDLQSSGGQLAPGAVIGRGGIQEAFDERLRGQPGVVVEEVGAQDGEPAPGAPLFETPPTPGEPVRLTLDRDLQATAEELLADVDSPSAIVAIRPSTGELVTAASGPASEGWPTALLGQYAPGSTFKVVTALAMLREGDTPESVVQCPPDITVDGVRFANAGSYPEEFLGPITLTEAMAHSCNTVFLGQHERISQAELAEAAAALGVGVPAGLPVPTFPGSVPEEEPPVQHASALFGQGRTLVSPLAMAEVAASVSAGERVSPRLVAEDTLREATTPTPDPSASATAADAAASAAPVTEEEAAQLRTMMRAVVSSGHLGVLGELQPDTAIAKTGTAEFGDEDPPRTHSWVIAAHEDLAVAVFVEDGDLGAITGGPLALEFLQAAAAEPTGDETG